MKLEHMFTVGLVGKLYNLNLVIKLFFNVIVINLHVRPRFSRVANTAFTHTVVRRDLTFFIILEHTRNFNIHTLDVDLMILILMQELIIS